MTLADAIIGMAPQDAVLAAELKAVPKMVVTNVAEYYYHHDREFWRIGDFPGARPPLNHCWVEYRMPRTIRSAEVAEFSFKVGDDSTQVHFGALVSIGDWGSTRIEDVSFDFKLKVGDAFSICGRYFYVQGKKVTWAKDYVQAKYHIHEDGGIDFAKFPSGDADGKTAEELAQRIYCHHPILLAFSFANCKNVEVVKVSPPPRLNKARKKRGKEPLTVYSIINILPIASKAPRNRSVESEDGAGVALHVRRGHFAEYGEKYGKGKLFGKYEGRYWIQQSSVGEVKFGESKHDYEVGAR